MLISVPGPQGDPSADGFGMMMMLMVGWVVIATALFLLRPQSLRRQPDAKPRPEPVIIFILISSLPLSSSSLMQGTIMMTVRFCCCCLYFCCCYDWYYTRVAKGYFWLFYIPFYYFTGRSRWWESSYASGSLDRPFHEKERADKCHC